MRPEASGTDAQQPTLVHGVRASSPYWTSLWNFQLNGTRTSIDVVNREFRGVSVRDMDLEILRGPVDAWMAAWPSLALSPFLMMLWEAGIIRSGRRLGIGAPPYKTRWIDDPDQLALTLRAADREIALEETRRAVAPNAASRLSCVYCAPDTPRGRNLVERVTGPEAFVVRVRVIGIIAAIAVCDSTWLERWPDAEAREAYWRGVASENPQWEVLVDGMIEAVDAAELGGLREYVRTIGPPQDTIAGGHLDP